MYHGLHTFICHDPTAFHRKLCCKICGQYYRGSQSLVHHILKEHSGKDLLKCSHCLKYFMEKSSYDLHLNFGCSANPSNSKMDCNLCERKFEDPKKLREHVIRTHIRTTEGN